MTTYCRISHPSLEGPRHAVVRGSTVIPMAPGFNYQDLPFMEEDPPLELSEVKLLAPVVNPSKIVCVGRNYREHAAELGNKMPDEPLLFLKAPSSIIGPDDRIEIPSASQQVEYEGEVGVVMGFQARNLRETDGVGSVFGYTCVNDVTARDLQRKDVQFTRGKSFDTFCPVGPFIVTDLFPEDLTVTTRLNGEVKQTGRTVDMAFDIAFLIRYISQIMTLYPGDLILTGTPAGVSRMKHGDTVEVEVSGVGVLRNQVYDPSQIKS